MPSSQSVLTQIISNMELTHLGWKGSNFSKCVNDSFNGREKSKFKGTEMFLTSQTLFQYFILNKWNHKSQSDVTKM